MRDLLNIIDTLTEATIGNYPWGTPFLIGTSVAGSKLKDELEPQGINTEDPVYSVNPADFDPETIDIRIGNGKANWAFRDSNDQMFLITVSPNTYFVHAAKLGNRGEIAEGILGAAMFAKFTKRAGNEEIGSVSVADIHNVLTRLENVAEDIYQVNVKDSDNKHADTITFKLVLKTKPYQDLMNPANRETLKQEFSSAAAYVNSAMAERYSKYFYLNGKADDIVVVADGTSDEKGSKVDVWVGIKDDNGNIRKLRLNASLKAGPVKQFGQVGGSDSKSMKKLWDHFNIDVTPWLEEFDQMSVNDKYGAIQSMYSKVARIMRTRLSDATPQEEVAFVDDLAHAIDYFATLGDKNVELVQFDKGGFKILRFGNLARKFRSIDLTAVADDTKTRPEIRIFDINNPKDVLVIIRCKVELEKNYVRNIIEKGPLLEKLTKVGQKAWDDEPEMKVAKRQDIKNPLAKQRSSKYKDKVPEPAKREKR